MVPRYTSLLLSSAALSLGAAVLLLSDPAPSAAVRRAAIEARPDFYGRIDIGAAPRPRILHEPMIIERGLRQAEPLYLRVRPGHARRWKLHCGEYAACGQRVYFVQDDWYRDVYAPYQRGAR